MCDLCRRQLGRRSFLTLAALGVAIATVRPGWAAHGEPTKMSADEALARLKQGNAKYVQSPQLCAMDLTAARRDASGGQAPWATILTCSDSRVPPELVFGGVGVGEFFVARNAGNMADTATMGTIEYGAAMLGAPLIVVMGHERCGAVEAACEAVEKNATFPGSIGPMVDAIVPVARAVQGQPGDFVDNVVRRSAVLTAQKIAKSPIVESLVASGKVKVLPARYDLESGAVEYLE